MASNVFPLSLLFSKGNSLALRESFVQIFAKSVGLTWITIGIAYLLLAMVYASTLRAGLQVGIGFSLRWLILGLTFFAMSRVGKRAKLPASWKPHYQNLMQRAVVLAVTIVVLQVVLQWFGTSSEYTYIGVLILGGCLLTVVGLSVIASRLDPPPELTETQLD